MENRADIVGGLQCMSPELRALVAGVQGQLPEPGINWVAVRELAFVHAVTPLLHMTWHKAPGIAPAAVLEEFKRTRREGLLRTMLSLQERDAVVKLLYQREIPFLVLKGAALSRVWYCDPSLRPFLDIDLLVPEREVRRTRQILMDVGFQDLSDPGAPHHLAPLAHPQLPCAVELHHRLARLPLRHTPLFEELASRAIPLDATGVARTLGPEDTLLHLCLHLLSHVEHDQGWQLRQLCDIACHLRSFALDWTTFEARARDLAALRGCRAVLGLARVVAGARAPARVIDEVAALELLQYPLRGRIDHRLLAAFLEAARRAHLGRAATIALGTVGNGDQGESFLGILSRLVREGLRDPRSLASQTRLWLPEAERFQQREGLLASLFAE